MNPAYLFAREIIQTFDRRQFPNDGAQIDNRYFGVVRRVLLKQHVTSDLGAALPDLVIANMNGLLITNTREWCYLNGLLESEPRASLHQMAQKKVEQFLEELHVNNSEREAQTYLERLGLPSGHRPFNKQCIEQNARQLLQQLNIQQNLKSSATQQLWTHIFNTVYVQGDAGAKELILQWAQPVNSVKMDISLWDIRSYRIKKAVGNFFNNGVVKIITKFVVIVGMIKVFNNILSFIQVVWFPRLVNYFINHAPLSLVGRVNQLLAFREVLYAHRIKMMLISILLRVTFGRYIPGIHTIINWSENLIFLSYTIKEKIRGLAHALGDGAYNMQDQISASVANVADVALQERLILGGQRAYEIWMDLLPQAQETGIHQS